jgi:hypothetical protein
MDGSSAHAEVPIGAAVVAASGEMLGKIHTAHPHFFVFEQATGSPPADYEVPMHAVSRVEGGRVLLTVNLEALSRVPDEQQSAAHRMHEEQ